MTTIGADTFDELQKQILDRSVNESIKSGPTNVFDHRELVQLLRTVFMIKNLIMQFCEDAASFGANIVLELQESLDKQEEQINKKITLLHSSVATLIDTVDAQLSHFDLILESQIDEIETLIDEIEVDIQNQQHIFDSQIEVVQQTIIVKTDELAEQLLSTQETIVHLIKDRSSLLTNLIGSQSSDLSLLLETLQDLLQSNQEHVMNAIAGLEQDITCGVCGDVNQITQEIARQADVLSLQINDTKNALVREIVGGSNKVQTDMTLQRDRIRQALEQLQVNLTRNYTNIAVKATDTKEAISSANQATTDEIKQMGIFVGNKICSMLSSIQTQIVDAGTQIGAKLSELDRSVVQEIDRQQGRISCGIADNYAQLCAQLSNLQVSLKSMIVESFGQFDDALIDKTAQIISRISELDTSLSQYGSRVGLHLSKIQADLGKNVCVKIANLESAQSASKNQLSVQISNMQSSLSNQLCAQISNMQTALTIQNNEICSQISTIGTDLNKQLTTDFDALSLGLAQLESTLSLKLNDLQAALSSSLSIGLNNARTSLTLQNNAFSSAISAAATDLTTFFILRLGEHDLNMTLQNDKLCSKIAALSTAIVVDNNLIYEQIADAQTAIFTKLEDLKVEVLSGLTILDIGLIAISIALAAIAAGVAALAV